MMNTISVSRALTAILVVMTLAMVAVHADSSSLRSSSSSLEKSDASSRNLEASGDAVDTRTPIKFVLIGDSYSSGNGARDVNGDRNYFGPQYCYRMAANWGQTYASELNKTGQYAVTFLNRACAVAHSWDIFAPQKQMFYNVKCPEPKFPDELYVQNTPVSCQYYIRPQLDAVDEDTDLVMLTMGTNDWGIGPMMWTCLAFQRPRLCLQALNLSKKAILNLPVNLTNVLTAVYDKMKPTGKVVIMSTPLMLLANIPSILRAGPRTTFDATAEIRGLLFQHLASAQAAVAAANDARGVNFAVFYNETPAYFTGHEMDPRPFRRNPNRWIREIETQWINEFFHPYPDVWVNWGKLIAQKGTFGAPGTVGVSNGSPHAWMGEAYSGTVGVPLIFEAYGSYDPKGYKLASYEWDFNNDGVFEVQTTVAMASRVFSEPGFSTVVLRVTSQSGQTATTQAVVQIRKGNEATPDTVDDISECPTGSTEPIAYVNGTWTRCALFG